jgi:hypothetical protein
VKAMSRDVQRGGGGGDGEDIATASTGGAAAEPGSPLNRWLHELDEVEETLYKVLERQRAYESGEEAKFEEEALKVQWGHESGEKANFDEEALKRQRGYESGEEAMFDEEYESDEEAKFVEEALKRQREYESGEEAKFDELADDEALLRHVFGTIDKDGNQFISREELNNALQYSHSKELVDALKGVIKDDKVGIDFNAFKSGADQVRA